MTEDAAPPLAGGRYRLVEVLGTGGMATVYRVYDALLDVFRAVKVLDPELTRRRKTRERFLNEARTIAKLRHPNIVSVFDMGMDGNRVFMLMELVEGGSLMDRVEHSGPVSPRLAVRVMIDVMKALDLSHRHGVVHRDVKPHNVLLTLAGTPKVTDFGIAAVNNDDHQLTRTGAVMGTWAYMAPEQRKDAKSVDARSDVYASAATLYAVVTGVEPLDLYVEETHAEMLAGLPTPLVEVLRKASRYRADQRHDSALALSAALEECLAKLPPDPAGTVPLVVPGDGQRWERPDMSGFDVSLVSTDEPPAPRPGADLPTRDDSSDESPFDPRVGFDGSDLQKLRSMRQSLPASPPPTEPDSDSGGFTLPPPPPELRGPSEPSSSSRRSEPRVDAAPVGPRPATARELSVAGISADLSVVQHRVSILPGGLKIHRLPLAVVLRAHPRVSHILLSFSGERFRCNVEVPAGKESPKGTTALRSEAPEDLIEGLNARRGVRPDGARWAAVLGGVGIVMASLVVLVLLQLPADLLRLWGLSLGLSVLAIGGGGVLALALVPVSLWSWWLGRQAVLMYDLDTQRLAHWRELSDALEVLAAARVDHVVGGSAGLETKQVRQRKIKLRRGVPSTLKVNLEGWSLTVDGVTITFMPDGVWVERRRSPLAIVRWGDVLVRSHGFVEGDTFDGEAPRAEAVEAALELSGPGLDLVLRSRQGEVLQRLRVLLETLVGTVAVSSGGSPGGGNGLGDFI